MVGDVFGGLGVVEEGREVEVGVRGGSRVGSEDSLYKAFFIVVLVGS